MNPIYQTKHEHRAKVCLVADVHHITHPSSDPRVASVCREPLGPGSLEVSASSPEAPLAPLTSELGQHAGQLEAQQ